MTEGENANAKGSENVQEGEDSERTVNCLRGRLLAERMASRNARDQAEKLGKKLMELENLLKVETKARNRAEKKLKFLMKKLASMNISYVIDESCLFDKTDISSVSSSTASSGTKEPERSHEPKENDKSSIGSADLPHTDSQHCLLSLFQNSSTTAGSSYSVIEVDLPDSTMPQTESECIEQSVPENAMAEDSLTSAGNSEKSEQVKTEQKYNDSADDELRDVGSSTIEGLKQEDDQDPISHVDNSMALVSVDVPQESHAIDPEVLDDTVKELLDTLKRAKELLLVSMERRRTDIIKVG